MYFVVDVFVTSYIVNPYIFNTPMQQATYVTGVWGDLAFALVNVKSSVKGPYLTPFYNQAHEVWVSNLFYLLLSLLTFL
jgi:hypothetical protein